MITRPLGDTGIQVSEIGIGCGGLGGPGKEGLEHVLEYAFDHGVTFYDTADMYAGGASEETLGRVFRTRRDRIVLASKFGTIVDPNGYHKDVSVGHLREAIAGSLKRLCTDHIDVYQLHNPPMSCLEDDRLWDALDRLVEEGTIRCYGLSIDSGADAVRFLERTNGRTIQINISLFNQGAREPFLADAAERRAGVIIKVPMAGGTLTGRFTRDYPPPTDERRQRWGEEAFARRLALAENVRPILERPGRTMAQGALAWLLSFDAVSAVIPGVSSLEKVKETIGAAGMRLTPEERRALDDLDGGALRRLRLGW